MKTYVIFAVKAFDCTVQGKNYHCVRAMVGEVEKVGSTWKVKNIKLIKCSQDFQPEELNKPVTIYFDNNGKAVLTKPVSA